MRTPYISILLFIIVLTACNDSIKSPTQLFTTTTTLIRNDFAIDEESLGSVEGIQCNDTSLVVFDVHSGQYFSLFDLRTGACIRRFGSIGEGPNEILRGTYGNVEGNKFTVFYDETGVIAQYHLDSLYQRPDEKLRVLMKYQFPDASFSRVIPINDTVFFGAGIYQQAYQYAVFNNKNEVTDFAVDIFNAGDEAFNIYSLFLSNQGRSRKHPTQPKFVYSLNYSPNIDFIEVMENKLQVIKSIRLKVPKFTTMQSELFSQVTPNDDSVLGYLDIATNKNYVYGLYTDKEFVDDGIGNTRSSNIVLVFDWEGNPVKMYLLKDEAYHITINEATNVLYASIVNKEGGWSIVAYDLPN